jgi:hypothetical protein
VSKDYRTCEFRVQRDLTMAGQTPLELKISNNFTEPASSDLESGLHFHPESPAYNNIAT